MAVCGGNSRAKDWQILKEGRNVIVGTPVRFLDMLSHGLSPLGLRVLVIDELDELISRGFKDTVYELFDLAMAASPQIQLAMFTTSFEGETGDAINDLVREPFCQIVSLDYYARHFYVDVEKGDWKYSLLLDLAQLLGPLLVCCNSKRKAVRLHELLGAPSMLVGRSAAVSLTGKTFFVTEDVPPDRPPVKVYVNFDLPSPELYLRRVDRFELSCTNRLTIINFVTGLERPRLRELEADLGTTIFALPVNINELV